MPEPSTNITDIDKELDTALFSIEGLNPEESATMKMIHAKAEAISPESQAHLTQEERDLLTREELESVGAATYSNTKSEKHNKATKRKFTDIVKKPEESKTSAEDQKQKNSSHHNQITF